MSPIYFSRLLLILALCATAACGAKPESNSGGDAYRHVAAPMVLDDWNDGQLAYGEGDRTDWKKFELDQAAKVYLTLSVDKEDSGVELACYNRVGVPMGTVTKKEGTSGEVRLVMTAPSDGLYFIKVQATGGEPTSYSLRASLSADSDSRSNNSALPDF